MARSVTSSTARGKSKSSSSRRARTSTRPRLSLKARVLAAVYRIAKRKTSPPRAASHIAIKKHLLAREEQHPKRYAQLNTTSLARIKRELQEDGALTRPTSGSYAVDKDVKKVLEKQEGADRSDSSGDEAAAKSYFSTPQRQNKTKLLSSPSRRPRKSSIAAMSSSDDEASTSAIAVPVRVSSKKRSRTPTSKSRASDPAPAPKKPRSSTRGLALVATSFEEGDELDSDSDSGAPSSKTRSKTRSKRVKVNVASSPAPRPRKKATTTSKGAEGKTGLSHLKKADLISRDEQLRERIEELVIELEQEKERAGSMEREKRLLAQGFIELRTLHDALRDRLGKYEDVEDDAVVTQPMSGSTETGLDPLDEDQYTDLGGMEQEVGRMDDDEPYYHPADDSGFAEVKVPTPTRSRENTIIPDSHKEASVVDAERPHSPRPRPFTPTHQTVVEQEPRHLVRAASFTSSYPELEVDTQPREQRKPSRTPPGQQHSWASIHPPSPAASHHEDQRQTTAAQPELAGEAQPAPSQGVFPTPDLSSSPVKQVVEGRTPPLAPTIVDEEEERRSADEEQDAARLTRLERELVEVRVELGEVEFKKDVVQQELELVSKRFQDQVDSTTAQTALTIEGHQAQLSTLENQLQELREESEKHEHRALALADELQQAKDALFAAEEIHARDQARIEMISSDLDIVSEHHRSTVADSAGRLTDLQTEYETLETTVQELEQQLTAGVEQLSASEAHITELTRDLEDATRENKDLMKTDVDRQAALDSVNSTLDDLTSQVESLQTAFSSAESEKRRLEEHIGRLEGEAAAAQAHLQATSALLADQEHRFALLQHEMDVITLRHQDQLRALNAELEQGNDKVTELESSVSILAQRLSATESQLIQERQTAERMQLELDAERSSHEMARKDLESQVTTDQLSIEALSSELEQTRLARDAAISAQSSTESALATVRQQLWETAASLQQQTSRSATLSTEVELISTHYRDQHEVTSAELDEKEASLSDCEEKAAALENELREKSTAAEDLRGRVQDLEDQLSAAKESHSDLVKMNSERQTALAESTRRIEAIMVELDAAESAIASLSDVKSTLEHRNDDLQQRLDIATSERDHQLLRVQALQLEVEGMARAYQDQDAEARKELGLLRAERVETEERAGLLQEELTLIHAQLLKEQEKSDESTDRVEGMTQSYNALVLEQQELKTLLAKEQKDLEQASAKADGLLIDLDTSRAEKSRIEAHVLTVDQDLTKTEGLLTTTREELEQEKETTETLRSTLEDERESHANTLQHLQETTERVERLQRAYDVIVSAESELRSSLRSLVTERGIAPSFSTDAPHSYITALAQHIGGLDHEISTTSSVLDSAQSSVVQLLSAFPSDFLSSPTSDTEASGGGTALERDLKKALERLSLTVQLVETTSADLEQTRTAMKSAHEEKDASQVTLHHQDRLLETLRSKMLELNAVLISTEETTSTDLEPPSSHEEALPHLIEQIKQQAMNAQHLNEQRKGEVHRLTQELEEETTKRGRAVARLGEKTKECTELQDKVASLKSNHGRALSLIKQGSEILEGTEV